MLTFFSSSIKIHITNVKLWNRWYRDSGGYLRYVNTILRIPLI